MTPLTQCIYWFNNFNIQLISFSLIFLFHIDQLYKYTYVIIYTLPVMDIELNNMCPDYAYVIVYTIFMKIHINLNLFHKYSYVIINTSNEYL